MKENTEISADKKRIKTDIGHSRRYDLQAAAQDRQTRQRDRWGRSHGKAPQSVHDGGNLESDQPPLPPPKNLFVPHSVAAAKEVHEEFIIMCCAR